MNDIKEKKIQRKDETFKIKDTYVKSTTMVIGKIKKLNSIRMNGNLNQCLISMNHYQRPGE